LGGGIGPPSVLYSGEGMSSAGTTSWEVGGLVPVDIWSVFFFLGALSNRSFGGRSPTLVGSSVNSICCFGEDEDESALVALMWRE
jgi:hypothetical protein